MAKRSQDQQLTKDDWERDRSDRGHEGGPDSSVDPVKTASSEVLKGRIIRQPKSRFSAGAPAASRPTAPVPAPVEGFGFNNTPPAFSASSMTSSTPAGPPPANGTSGGLFGASPVKPFAGFGALNGGGTPAGSPAPAANPSPVKNNPFASLSKTPAGTPLGLFGGTSTTPAAPPKFTFGSTPATAPPAAAEKKEEVPAKKNPFSTFAPLSASTASTTPPSPAPAATFKTPTPASSLFGNVASTASMGLFGSTAKIGENTSNTANVAKQTEEKAVPPPAFMFGQKPAEPAKSDDKSESTSNSLFGRISYPPVAAAPVSLNSTDSSSTSGEIKYPALPPASSTSTPKNAFAPSAPATNGTPAFSNPQTFSPAPARPTLAIDMDLDRLPPPPSDWSQDKKEYHDQLLLVKSLNASYLEAMKSADLVADWRGMHEIYANMFDKIMSGSLKRKEPTSQNEESPKRSKTETGSSAAKLFGDIVNKSIGSSGSSTAAAPSTEKKTEPEAKKTAPSDGPLKKPLFEFKPPTGAPPPTSSNTAKVIEKPLFGFTPPTSTKAADKPAPAPAAEKPAAAPTPAAAPPSIFSASNTSAPAKPNIFGSTSSDNSSGGNGSIFGSKSTSGGIFSNLKPEPSESKDKGEGDSPLKPTPGLFSSGAPADKPAQPFFFGGKPAAASTTTPEKSTNIFSTGASDKVDQTWKPGTPIKFGSSPASGGTTSGGLFGSSTAAAPTASTTGGSLFGSNAGTGFSFGAGSTTSAASSMTSNPPSFGLFGSSNNSATSSSQAPAASTGFKFGASAPAPSTNTNTNANTSATSSDAESVKPSSSTATTTTTTAPESNDPSDTVVTTKTDLSGPGPGEENDDVIFSVSAAVYAKDDATNKVKKVAVGTSRVLKDKDTGKARLLVRTEQGKVVVNVWLVKGLSYVVGGQGRAVVVPDLSSKTAQGGMKVYTVRVRNEELATELSKWCEEVKC